MDERRKNHAMRRFVEVLLADVATGARTISSAAEEMRAAGVPVTVAARVLAGRRS